MKARDRSTKSAREKSVALTWLQGGHHTAPQYRNTGLPDCLASAKALSTSASDEAGTHWMPPLVMGTAAETGARPIGAKRIREAATTALSRGRCNVDMAAPAKNPQMLTTSGPSRTAGPERTSSP